LKNRGRNLEHPSHHSPILVPRRISPASKFSVRSSSSLKTSSSGGRVSMEGERERGGKREIEREEKRRKGAPNT
jgi:hypothetical protein